MTSQETVSRCFLKGEWSLPCLLPAFLDSASCTAIFHLRPRVATGSFLRDREEHGADSLLHNRLCLKASIIPLSLGNPPVMMWPVGGSVQAEEGHYMCLRLWN